MINHQRLKKWEKIANYVIKTCKECNIALTVANTRIQRQYFIIGHLCDKCAAEKIRKDKNGNQQIHRSISRSGY